MDVEPARTLNDLLVLWGGVLGGAGMLAVSIWSWAGRSEWARRWAHQTWGPEMRLGVMPGLGLMVLPASLGTLFDVAGCLGGLMALVILFGLIVGSAGALHLLPRWWGPRWYRELAAGERKPDTQQTLTALAVAGTEKPRVVSAQDAKRRFGRARAHGSWRGGYIYDPDTRERAHGLARRGTVEGTLSLYKKGLTFAASKVEDTLRDEPTVVVLERDAITGARVVAPRAGADGRPRKGWLYRSIFPRLVVDTAEASYVFELGRGRAREVAERINEMVAEET